MKTFVTMIQGQNRLLACTVWDLRHCEAADFTCVFSGLSSSERKNRVRQDCRIPRLCRR
jgi:hypothetical protein